MNDQINSDSNGLVSLLDKALDGGNCEEALLLVNDSKFNQYFEDGSSWDLIPVVCKFISQTSLDRMPDVVHCCEVLLVNISSRAHPEESLLEFIELAECVENNILFFALLSPMQTCLKRKVQRGNFLQFCLNSIEYHVINQRVPQAVEELEAEDLLIEDSDPTCKEIIELYLASHKFYDPFLSEISISLKINTTDIGFSIDQVHNERNCLICFVMQLLGKPLASFNLMNSDPKTAARTIAELLVFDLKRLCNNLMIFLEYAEIRDIQEHRNKEEETPDESSYDIFLLASRVSTLSMGVLCYLIYVEEIMLDEVPCVYNTLYLLQICLYLSTKLVQESSYHIVMKGLTLAGKMLCRVRELEIPYKMLELPTIERFVKALTFKIVYYPSSKLRQIALKVFKSFIFKFEQQGRYLLMCNMHNSITHSGLLGYLITELKDMIDYAIAIHPTPTPFSGKKLFTLLKLYCALPDVAIKDVLDSSSQITASLNLLRFVIIRDKQNVTGIWDYLDHFEEHLFEPLRKTIDLSRESINVEFKNMSEKKNQAVMLPEVTEKKSVGVTVTVSGKEVPNPSIDDESMTQQFYNTLNILDVMASVLFRLKECIQLSSQKQKTI